MLDKNNKLVYGEEFSKEKFRHPSKEFGILPFWFVNGEMDYGEMAWQMKQFAEAGLPGIIFHSRFGIKDYMPYLGEEWLKRYQFAADKARELGLQTWVYDEYNWPSGTCNQEIMKEDPELTGRYLQLVINDIPGQFFVFMEGTDSRYNDLEQSEPVYACAILEENLKNGVNETVNLLPNLAFDKVISWEAPKGPWKLCYFIERQTSWYADVLNPEAPKRFIEKTHQKYRDHIQGDFPQNLRGFYTDEPAMHYFEAGADNFIIPWSRQMFKIFYDENGYDLKKRLPQLFFDIGEDFHKVRYDFWSCLSKQYERSYYKQIHDWCQQNEVFFTGHLLHEEMIRAHAKSGGNLFHMLKNMDMTGVDHLYPRIGTREMPNEHVALKIASSAAHQNGSVRLLCESMGGSYWDCTMERMKWIADWEYVLGVNIFNPHGFHYSIEGERKRDWPPSQFYHHSWWKDYGRFNTYLERLGYLMTGGHHVARVGVMYPINNIWADFVPQKASPASALCESDFVYMTDRLLRLHYDFDYIDEDMMRKMEIRDGKLCIRGEEYSLLILPPMTHIKENTLRLLRKFCRQGGKIIADALVPEALLERDGTTSDNAIAELFGVDPKENNTRCLAGEYTEYKTIESDFGEGKVVVLQGPGLHVVDGMNTLGEAIGSLIDWDVAINSEELFYLHRVKDGVPFYFVINPTGESISADISLRGKGSPVYYDLLNGGIEPMYKFHGEADYITFRWSFAPYGSAMFSLEDEVYAHIEPTDFTVMSIKDGVVHGYGRCTEPSAELVDQTARKFVTGVCSTPLKEVPLSTEWKFSREGENALLIQNWKFAMANQVPEDFYRPDLNSDDAAWLEYTMGGWELQLPYERYEKNYPVDIVYKARFRAGYLPEDIKMLIDGFKCDSYHLYINGNEVTEKGERSSLDAEIRQIAIRKYLVEGDNDISIAMTVSQPLQGLLDYIKLVGTFSVQNEEICAPKDHLETGVWTQEGYPYFSGTGRLTQTVELPKEYCSGQVLKLELCCGKDVAHVSVNGQNAGVMLWEPYEVDITPFVHEGQNTITVEVTNTMINLLEAKKQASGVTAAKIVPYPCFELK